MKKLYRLLLLAVLTLGVDFSAKAVNYCAELYCSNWQAINLEKVNATGDVVRSNIGKTNPANDYEDLTATSTDNNNYRIHVLKGYKAEIKNSKTDEIWTPDATPASDEYSQSYTGYSIANYGGTSWGTAPDIYVTISEDAGGDVVGDGKDWPKDGYGYDIHWDNADAIYLQQGSYVSKRINLPAGTTEYRYWIDDKYGLPARIYPNDGYKIKRVYAIDAYNAETEINALFDGSYSMNVSDYDRQNIYVETEKEVRDAKFTVTFVNTPEAFNYIQLGVRSINATFTKGVAQEFEFASASEKNIDFYFNANTWTLDSDNEKVYRHIYKLKKNGIDITSAADKDGFYSTTLADGDRFEIQPFEVDPNKATCTVTVEAPEGVIQSFFNRTDSHFVKLDANNQIELLEGTVFQVNFNDDITFGSATFNGVNLENWTDGGGRFVVNASGTLKITATATVYTESNYTAYITNAEGVTVYEGTMDGKVIELGEGEALANAIEIPKLTISTENGTVTVYGYTMTSADTRKYTFPISSKYDRFLVMPKPGYWLRTTRGTSLTNKELANGKSFTDKTVYVVAEKIENDSKATVYFAGKPGSVGIRASRLNEAEITHAITAAGYTEFGFDADFEAPFDLTGINVSEAGTYVGGEASANVNVYCDNVICSPDENGVYTGINIKNGSVIKIFADGKLYNQQQIHFDAAPGATAEVKYDRTFAHTDFSSYFKCHEGTEITIKPGKNTSVKINHVDADGQVINSDALTANAQGICTYIVPAASRDVAKHVVALAYDGSNLSEYTLTPAAGTLTEKPNKLTIAFPNATSATIAGESADEITFRMGQAVALRITDVDAVAGAECPTFEISFVSDYMPNGTYSLFIPKGFFNFGGDVVNPDIRASYTLAVPFTDFDYKADPYTGKTRLTENGIDCGIYFTNDEARVQIADRSKIKVTLNGTVLTEGVSYGTNENVFYFNIKAANAALGTLALDIEAGALKVSGSEAPAISASWQVVKPKEKYAYTITPADGTKVDQISSVTIAFTDAESADIYMAHGIDLFNFDVDYIQTGKITAVADAQCPTFKVDFETPATEAGVYTLRVFGGTFTLDGVSACEAMEAEYIIADAMTAVITPADGLKVQAVEAITIAFPYAAAVTVNNAKLGDILVSDTNDSYSSKCTEVKAVADAAVPTFEFILEKGMPVAAGEYNVSIPKGLFSNGTDTNEAIASSFTIAPKVDYSWSLTPEGDIDLTDDLYAVTVPVCFVFNDEDLEVSFDDPLIEVMINDTELVAEEDFTFVAEYNYIKFNIKAEKLTAGTLTVEILPASLEINGKLYYETMKASWTIKDASSGITDVTIEAADGAIYNLQGIRLNSDFNKLPAGIYIQNGRKVLKH